jgi:Zn-dependent M28 family amino/carboxypeptidase
VRRPTIALTALTLGATAFVASGYTQQGRSAAPPSQSIAASSSSPDYVAWPLSQADRAYGAIDGKHIWQYVAEQTAISRRYRDAGHQFWGRIIGTQADAESSQWLLDRFKKIGMTDTKIQPIDLLPQWMPQSWDVTASGGGNTVTLPSVQPFYRSPGTQGQGLDLEAVYVELGSEADYAGLDVKGKAVFISRYAAVHRGVLRRSAPEPNAIKRAEEKGAAAIFDVNEMPGNMKFQPYPANTSVPTFSIGTRDGHAVIDLIDKAAAGQAAHVRIRMDVQMVPNLKTALVWGTLPGASDETIYVIAHRDGWFEAAGDNASGVASMIGLAEYFAKVPKNQRRRTMTFIGIDGHHNTGPGGSAGETWLADQKTLFAKTALMINDEHPSNVDTYYTADEKIGLTNTYVPLEWYAGGPSRPELTKIAVNAWREFGLWRWDRQSQKPPNGDLDPFRLFLPGVDAQSNDFFFFHTDANTAETVPWTGLEAATRSYARIIDEVNKLDLKDLQRPPEPDPGRGSQPTAASPSNPELLQWPLAAADRAYGAIDGRHIWQYVGEEAAIARRYRDQGHPQYWGRIMGTSGDAESAQWLLDKFKKTGLVDTHIQPLDLAPQWTTKGWEATVTAGGKTVPLTSAQPAYGTPATPAGGVDVEGVYVGLGREADFARHDVKGKAAFVFMEGDFANFSSAQAGEPLRRAAEKGAVVVFAVVVIPKGMKAQFYPVETPVPAFALALHEGEMVRDFIAAGHVPRVKVRLDAEMDSTMKSALVWGTLPGATDETIYVEAHRDGWFDASGDNGDGVASMVALAEYFAKIPQAQRRRTMVFVGIDGHHSGCNFRNPSKWCQPGSKGIAWMTAHKDELFKKTALFINDEHPANIGSYKDRDHTAGAAVRLTDSQFPEEWYAGGPSRPKLQKIVKSALRDFGVPMWDQESPSPPAGDLGGFSRWLPGVAFSSDRFFFFHLDGNTPDTVAWTGLEAATRALAKIIDEVNKLELTDLQRPEEPARGRGSNGQ